MKKKSFIVTELLCMLLGFLGVHRYYTGYISIGILQTLTLGGCGIWSMIDFIFISTNNYKDANHQELEGYNKNIAIAAVIIVVVLFLTAKSGIFTSNNNTIIHNNISSGSSTQSESDTQTQKVVKFGNRTCTVNKYTHYCNGMISEENKLILDKMSEELRQNN